MDTPTANTAVSINTSAVLLTEEDAVALAVLLLRSQHLERDWKAHTDGCRWKYRDGYENSVELAQLTPAHLAELALKRT